ncbi:universal stress protein [Modestobacter sp. NPDC049651]|uniref:universal stress protein n=1 Tax=unclassified Modestobacter TaxID=2643866 RepID=UPI0033CC6795
MTEFDLPDDDERDELAGDPDPSAAGVRTELRVDGGVVVGHDGSACAREALRWAAGLAARGGWALHVVRAWRMTTAPRPASWAPGYVPPLPDYEEAVRQELAAHVTEALGADPGCEVHTWAVHAPPTRALLSASVGADLLVVGARGRGGFAGLVLGSVSDQLVHHADCPVTVIRPGHGRPVAAR